ncbi:hypothetical protein KOR34_31470 [Posidoniimonas corsicana]|uniref:Uncharacterized protein n=1 Tax=Posidoniimonas corsicana TaxID=1938618 RepID=A0A5C5VJX6_9BACT|nr:hypothetical protein KOR34_31470 [Posidoniimonas corsicana]
MYSPSLSRNPGASAIAERPRHAQTTGAIEEHRRPLAHKVSLGKRDASTGAKLGGAATGAGVTTVLIVA